MKPGGPASFGAQLKAVREATGFTHEIAGLSRQEQTSGIRGRGELERAVGALDSIDTGVARQPLWTRREAIDRGARTTRKDVVIAHDGAHERSLWR